MPTYKFIYPNCLRELSLWVREGYLFPKCSPSGSSNLPHTISGLTYHKSLETMWEDSGESGINTTEDYYGDPRNIGRWAEKRFQEAGRELPAQVQEKIRATRECVLPEPFKEFESASPNSARD